MRYCPKTDCTRQLGYADHEATFCGNCGTELTPYIVCLCGKDAYTPRLPHAYCLGCGVQFTEAYLGQCMATQLKGIVKEITEQQMVIPGGFLD